jgi:8-oxo-dGTP diphosphatase
VKRIVAGVLRREGRVLICQRARGGVQALQWEFPGGKVEAGEEERAALARELREELGIEAKAGRLLARVRHRYAETGELELAFYEIAAFEGEPENRVFEAIAWEKPDQLATYDFLAADRPLLEQVARHFLPGSLPSVAQSAGFDLRQETPASASGVSKLPPLAGC